MLGKTDKKVRDTQDLMKTSNIGVLVSEERDMWTEATFDEIMAAFFFKTGPKP